MLRSLLLLFVLQFGMLISMPVYAGKYISEIALCSAYKRWDRDNAKNRFRGNGFTLLSNEDICVGMGNSSYYVYLGYKTTDNVNEAIRDVIILEGNKKAFVEIDGTKYTPCSGCYDNDEGDINAYKGSHTQAYIYVAKEINNRPDHHVLTGLSLSTSKNNASDAQVRGGSSVSNLGNGYNLNWQGKTNFYLNTSWHSHVNWTYENTGDMMQHNKRCVDCGVVMKMNHYYGIHENRSATEHYQECTYCKYQLVTKHSFSSYSSLSDSHAQVCNVCGYLIPGKHDGLNDTFIAVDDEQHLTYCTTCNHSIREPHDLSEGVEEENATCSRDGVMKYTCRRCQREVRRIIPHSEHQYNESGLCTEPSCMSPFKEPERSAEDHLFRISNYGELLWFADHVNGGFTEDGAMLVSAITAVPEYEWIPVGKTRDLAYKGTFHGNNHVLSALTAKSGGEWIALFGFTDTTAVVSNIHLASCAFVGDNYVGGVVASNKGTVMECILTNCDMDARKDGAYIGGIAAVNEGVIVNCSVDDATVIGSKMTYSGGICGQNNHTVTDNTTKATNHSSGELPHIARGDAAGTRNSTTKGASVLYAKALSEYMADAYAANLMLQSYGITLDISEDTDTQDKGMDEQPNGVAPVDSCPSSLPQHYYSPHGTIHTHPLRGVNIIRNGSGNGRKVFVAP